MQDWYRDFGYRDARFDEHRYAEQRRREAWRKALEFQQTWGAANKGSQEDLAMEAQHLYAMPRVVFGSGGFGSVCCGLFVDFFLHWCAWCDFIIASCD